MLALNERPAVREAVRPLTTVETAAVAGGPSNTGFNATFAASVASDAASGSMGFNLGYLDPAETMQTGDKMVFNYNNGSFSDQTGNYVVWNNVTQNSWGYYDLSAYPDNNS